MNQAIQYRDDFLADMAPALADEYRRWYPYCRQTVLATIDRIGTREFLEQALGQTLSDQRYQALRTAWFEPYRSYHTRSGKMLRPFLVCFCAQAFGRDPATMPTLVAIAEIIHAASLILDDIADDSPLRRGGPSAHRMVGVGVAGAGALAWLNVCFELLSQQDLGIGPAAAAVLMEEIAWEHWVTGIGTTIDTTWPWLGRFDQKPAEYLQSVLHRSTSYTYRLPFKIGAIAAGASKQQFDQFAALGEELGLAFQIVDDILNLQPSDAHWGKALAEDLTQGKITLQVLLALERTTPHERARLIEILTSRTDDPAPLREATGIMDRSGAFAAARAIARRHVERTKEIAAAMDFLSATDRAKLNAFIDYTVNRSR
jgi:geranylgeranyl pyrophosphate synthase